MKVSITEGRKYTIWWEGAKQWRKEGGTEVTEIANAAMRELKGDLPGKTFHVVNVSGYHGDKCVGPHAASDAQQQHVDDCVATSSVHLMSKYHPRALSYFKSSYAESSLRSMHFSSKRGAGGGSGPRQGEEITLSLRCYPLHPYVLEITVYKPGSNGHSDLIGSIVRSNLTGYNFTPDVPNLIRYLPLPASSLAEMSPCGALPIQHGVSSSTVSPSSSSWSNSAPEFRHPYLVSSYFLTTRAPPSRLLSLLSTRRVTKGNFTPLSRNAFYRHYPEALKTCVYQTSIDPKTLEVKVTISVFPNIRDNGALGMFKRIRKFDTECAKAVELREKLVSNLDETVVGRLLPYCANVQVKLASVIGEVEVVRRGAVEESLGGWRNIVKVGSFWMRLPDESSAKKSASSDGGGVSSSSSSSSEASDVVVLMLISDDLIRDVDEEGIEIGYAALQTYTFGVKDLYGAKVDDDEEKEVLEDWGSSRFLRGFIRELKARHERIFVESLFRSLNGPRRREPSEEDGVAPETGDGSPEYSPLFLPAFEKAVSFLEGQTLIFSSFVTASDASGMPSLYDHVSTFLDPVPIEAAPASYLNGSADDEDDDDEADDWASSWWFLPSNLSDSDGGASFVKSVVQEVGAKMTSYENDFEYGDLFTVPSAGAGFCASENDIEGETSSEEGSEKAAALQQTSQKLRGDRSYHLDSDGDSVSEQNSEGDGMEASSTSAGPEGDEGSVSTTESFPPPSPPLHLLPRNVFGRLKKLENVDAGKVPIILRFELDGLPISAEGLKSIPKSGNLSVFLSSYDRDDDESSKLTPLQVRVGGSAFFRCAHEQLPPASPALSPFLSPSTVAASCHDVLCCCRSHFSPSAPQQNPPSSLFRSSCRTPY